MNERQYPTSISYNFYLWIVVFLLPISWFGPTGLAMREFGSKPLGPLLVCGGLYGLALCQPPKGTARRFENYALLFCSTILFFGSFAFLINQIASWSSYEFTRSPLSQFINQLLLIVSSFVAVLGNARLVYFYDSIKLLKTIFPAVAVFHLVIFILQSNSIIDHHSPFLMLFRTDDGIIERPTGLMHEPSFYGVFAALFGGVLLTLPSAGMRRCIYFILAVILYGTAIFINAKTMVMVMCAQLFLFILFPSNKRISLSKVLMLLGLVAGVAYYFVTTTFVLDVSENLSSNMRLGSLLMSINAAFSGYALSGIGIGQFHFFYNEVFAPDFLLLSQESLAQMRLDAPSRASTFNLYSRLLLEIGIIGFSAFLVMIVWLLRIRVTPDSFFITTLLTGSLGFLMTQDTYSYPPFLLSAALLLGLHYASTSVPKIN